MATSSRTTTSTASSTPLAHGELACRRHQTTWLPSGPVEPSNSKSISISTSMTLDARTTKRCGWAPACSNQRLISTLRRDTRCTPTPLVTRSALAGDIPRPPRLPHSSPIDLARAPHLRIDTHPTSGGATSRCSTLLARRSARGPFGALRLSARISTTPTSRVTRYRQCPTKSAATRKEQAINVPKIQWGQRRLRLRHHSHIASGKTK